ncbi:MAG TPA: DUF2089 family protein [Vicinamibacterales bacterium]
MNVQDWQALSRRIGDSRFIVERVRLADEDVAVEGRFEPPPLMQLSGEDQVFVAAFVRCHGSIKQMEALFEVSYPTIKNRLNRIGAQLPFVEIEPAPPPRAGSFSDLLSRLERGELTVADVLSQAADERGGRS